MTGTILGRYEYISIPEMMISALPATLEPGMEDTFLSIKDAAVYSGRGEPRLQFSLLSDPENRVRTLMLLGARTKTWPHGVTERIYRSAITMVLGSERMFVEIWLTTQRLRSTDLVIGQRFIPEDTEICAASAFLAKTKPADILGSPIL